MNRMNGTVGQSWVWGGSLLGLVLAAVTRQVALGVVPMAVIMPMWQWQKIQMIQTQYHQQQSRLQRQFDALQRDYLDSLANGQRQPSQNGQTDLHGLKNQIKDLQNNLGRTYTQVGHINNNQGSLLTQVQQLDVSLGHCQDQVAQVKDNQGSLQGQIHQLCSQTQQIQSQWDQMRADMQLDTSAMRQLTAVRQQLHCVMQDLLVLKLTHAQDLDLRQDMDRLRQDLDRVAQAQAKEPQRKPLGMFIDGANIHRSAQNGGFKLDYPQLVNQLANQFVRADVQPDVFFYSGYDPGNFTHQRFKQSLRAAGFRVKMSPVTYRTDGSSKANMDGQMIVDMLLGNYDRVLLLSGDGDFIPALTALRAMGTQVKVAAFRKDTNRDFQDFPFVDLTKLLQPGGQVVDLPQKQVPPRRQA